MIAVVGSIIGVIVGLLAMSTDFLSLLDRFKQKRAEAALASQRARKDPKGRYLFGMLTPERFFGRTAEIAQLRRLLLDEAARCVVLHAMAGSGKSSLAAVFINGLADGELNSDLPLAYRMGVGEEFSIIVWWRLTDAPALVELARELVARLEDDSPAPLPNDAELLSARIVAACGDRRVLLVLDNLETLLTPDDNRHVWRKGYENYQIFLRHVCEARSAISVLVTSREVPSVIYREKSVNDGVHVIQLRGLDDDSFTRILNASGDIRSSDSTKSWIAQRYSGNPLAARILQNYIRDVYRGDVDEFRLNEPEVVPEFEELLDFHFNRLTGFEKEMAYWLAINREPVSIETLKDDLLSADSRHRIPATLRRLQARIPLESHDRHYALQPVLLDYVTLRICTKVGGLFGCSSNVIARYVSRLLTDDIAREFENGEFALLDRIALLKAHTPEHVREAQRACLIQPLIERLVDHSGSRDAVRDLLRRVVAEFRETAGGRRSYIPSNLATLFLHLDGALIGEDLSRLTFIHPYFAGAQVRGVSFTRCNFIKPAFTEKMGAGLALDLSPCGRFVAVGDTLGAVRVWDLVTRELSLSAMPHNNWVRTVRYLDSDRLLSAGNEGDVCCICSRTGDLLKRLPKVHSDWINALARDSDGGFYSAGEDGRISAWSAELEKRWEIGLDGHLFDLAVDAGRGELVVAASGGALYFLSLSTGEVLDKADGHRGNVQCIAFDATGERIASGDDAGGILVRRREDLATLAEFPSRVEFARTLCFLGNILIVGGENSQIHMIDPNFPDPPARSFNGHAAAVRGMQVMTGGHKLVSVSEDKTLCLWEIKSGQLVDRHIGFSATLWSAHETADLRLVSGCETGELLVSEPSPNRSCRSYPVHRGRIFSVRAHPDQPVVATGGADCRVRLTDVRTGRSLGELVGHTDWVRELRFSASGERLFSCAEDRSVRCWDWEGREEEWRGPEHEGRVIALHVCPGDGSVYAGDESGAILRLDARSGKVLRDYAGHKGKVRAVTTAPARGTLFTCDEEGILRAWRVDGRKGPALAARVSECELWALAYLPGADALVAGNNRGMLLRLCPETGRVLQSVQAHEAPIWDLQAGADGKTLCSASGDETASRWDSAELKCLQRIDAPQPLQGTDFRGANGLSEGQKQSLRSLGASV